MNKKVTFISIGIFILLFIASVWVYLMLFGAPDDTGEVFANLGFQPTTQPSTVIPPIVDSRPIADLVDTNGGQLNQLTTRPVAGFTTYQTSSTSNPLVRYGQRGTGHLFDINLVTGEEERVTITTIPEISEMIWGSDTDRVAILTQQNYSTLLQVGTVANNGLQTITISSNASNIEFIDDNTLAYTEEQNGTTVGYQYNLTSNMASEQFRFSFSEVDVWWQENPPYILTKPAANLPTFAYQVEDDTVTRALAPRVGMRGFRGENYRVVLYPENNTVTSLAIPVDGSRVESLPVAAIEEKCAFDRFLSDFLWCAIPKAGGEEDFLEDWYKGVVVSNDYLMLLDINAGSAELIANPETLAGRPLDITHMDIDQVGNNLFFLNKTDRTLWRFDLFAE